MSETTPPQDHHSKEQEIFEVRLRKADDLRKAGVNPYGNGFVAEHTIRDIRRQLDEIKEPAAIESASGTYTIAGRVMAVRTFGKAAFVKLRDRTGDLQVWIKKDVLGDRFELFGLLDVGDVVGVA
ncbi:MAG: OB-fold nucleic acid binding domain-containing protein, partial [Myxococcales bacterium]